MPYDFIKITDVDLIEEVNESTNVMVEDNGELKRVSKSSIGAQADWNETDASNPAFILNKPTKMGGYEYYYYENYYLYKCDDHNFNIGERPVSQAEFEADYYSCPILLDSGIGISLIIYYDSIYSRMYFADGTTLQNLEINWYEDVPV